MFNYEWKREFKRVYLDVQHALNTKWDDDSTMDDNLAAVNALKETCERYMQENEMPIQAIRPTAPLTAPRIDENYPNEKIYACDAKLDVSGQYESERAILPIPCTNVEEKSVKDWLRKINEELDEFKEAVLGCATYEMAEQPVDMLEFDECEDIVAEEAADTITAITSMLEAMGIDEQARQEAQEQVNEKNEKKRRDKDE